MEKTFLKKLDRNIISIGSFIENPLEDTFYWLSKPPIERLIALELLRMRLSDYDNTSPRLQRIFTITSRE